ncbi:MAG: hypothetical protein HOJ13_02865 [Nitrospina sp.]|jgi:hypothetical protein|nr:hypothetical protein [Nitrospina sp.]
MSASGILGNLEPETILTWKELLIDLDFEYFRQSVVHICKTHVDFYPGTNIPALIRENASVFKSKDFAKKNTFKEKFEQYKLDAASPEEAKEFIDQAGFKLKEIPQATL